MWFPLFLLDKLLHKSSRSLHRKYFVFFVCDQCGSINPPRANVLWILLNPSVLKTTHKINSLPANVWIVCITTVCSRCGTYFNKYLFCHKSVLCLNIYMRWWSVETKRANKIKRKVMGWYNFMPHFFKYGQPVDQPVTFSCQSSSLKLKDVRMNNNTVQQNCSPAECLTNYWHLHPITKKSKSLNTKSLKWWPIAFEQCTKREETSTNVALRTSWRQGLLWGARVLLIPASCLIDVLFDVSPKVEV